MRVTPLHSKLSPKILQRSYKFTKLRKSTYKNLQKDIVSIIDGVLKLRDLEAPARGDLGCLVMEKRI